VIAQRKTVGCREKACGHESRAAAAVPIEAISGRVVAEDRAGKSHGSRTAHHCLRERPSAR